QCPETPAGAGHLGHWPGRHLGGRVVLSWLGHSPASSRMGCHAFSRTHLSALRLVDEPVPRSGHSFRGRRGHDDWPCLGCKGQGPMSEQAMITVKDLSVSFGTATAVKNISFTVVPGRCLALVGESGSGKSVTARSLLGLSGGTISATELTVCGQNALALPDRSWQQIRGNLVSMILQDALMALDPLRPVGREIGDALKVHAKLPKSERTHRVLQVLESVRMPEPERRAKQRSTELSGGMRQRALIAQALAGNPQVVIADEATTALDSALTALVLSQLRELKEQGRGVLMISHDLAQVAHLADDIAVMRHGEIVEAGTTVQILGNPQHEYTRQLLRAVPSGVPRFTALSAASKPLTAPLPNQPVDAAP